MTNKKTILITGATDGIGLAAAKAFVALGHHVLLHGRNLEKLQVLTDTLNQTDSSGTADCFVADLSRLENVLTLAQAIVKRVPQIDVLINNAGVLKAKEVITADGLDLRFGVNTLAPYLLTQKLLPLLGNSSRVINLSSAAQAPVDTDAIAGKVKLGDMEAYAQSKLAITMWTRRLANSLADTGIVFIAVNPGSLLASKMVKEGFGIAGKDINIGANILVRAALDVEFSDASGQYFDNDAGDFGAPHPDALDVNKVAHVMSAIETEIRSLP